MVSLPFVTWSLLTAIPACLPATLFIWLLGDSPASGGSGGRVILVYLINHLHVGMDWPIDCHAGGQQDRSLRFQRQQVGTSHSHG